MSDSQENPLLDVIGEAGPEEFARIIDRAIEALVETRSKTQVTIFRMIITTCVSLRMHCWN
jgi:hypothetical protein